MRLYEIMNLYKLSSYPEQLLGYDEMLRSSSPRQRPKYIIIRPNKTDTIKLPFFVQKFSLKKLLTNYDISYINKIWHGDPNNMPKDFLPSHRITQFEQLKLILERNGLRFTESWITQNLNKRNEAFYKFIMISGDIAAPKFIWFADFNNSIFPGVNKPKIATADFMEMSSKKQDEWLRTTKTKFRWRAIIYRNVWYGGQFYTTVAHRTSIVASTQQEAMEKMIEKVNSNLDHYEFNNPFYYCLPDVSYSKDNDDEAGSIRIEPSLDQTL